MEKPVDKDPDPLETAIKEFQVAWFSKKHMDHDEFCRAHPECEPDLREWIETFLSLEEILPALVQSRVSPSSSSPENLDTFVGQILDDYRILREIGRGGMGVVYEAEQISLKRKVALKILPPHLSLSGQAIKKFQREAEAGGRQKHPGIVAIYTLGEHKNVHFIAQELVEGGRTLADYIDDQRGKPVLPYGYFREVAGLAAEVALALAHAHDSGVIHRDVKPSNILLDPEGRPKVTDFGLALIEDALALSRTGDFAGTPYYMSPEQAVSRRGIDHCTDMFSLGVTLYEMLTLSRPFEGETSHEVLKRILFLEPRDPFRVNPRVPRDLSTICLKAMEKKPGHRYASMVEIAEDLKRFLAGEPILVNPPGAVTKFIKRVRRTPVVSGAVGIAALAVIALIVLIPIYMVKISQEATIAEGRRLIAQSTVELDRNPGTALLLALKAAKQCPGVDANNALIAALSICNERKAIIHTYQVLCTAFSPDGRFVSSGDTEGTLRIWDTSTWELKQEIQSHEDRINGLAYSPINSKLVVTAAEDGTVRLWNIEKGVCIQEFRGHGAAVRSAVFSPCGRKIVTASADMTARIWDVESGR
ncbi:MAG: serine/threonine-protein kinase, partial [Planctomycetota bacterium]